MNASELIDDYIANLTDWRGARIANIRKIIHEVDPKIVEEWKWSFEDKLFNSELEGNQWRAIDIYRDDKTNEASLKTLINAAVDYNIAKPETTNKAPGTQGTVPKKPAK